MLALSSSSLRLQIPAVAASSLSKADRFLVAPALQRVPRCSAFRGFLSMSVRNDQAPAASGVSAPFGGRGEQHAFPLSSSAVLKIMQGDITKWTVDGKTDAIVNAANEIMLGGGGVDGAIHRAAGPELLEACKRIQPVWPKPRCPTGEARITPAFLLPVAHVIHTVGPVYDSVKEPEVLLSNAYRNTLKLAKENNIKYIAFPAISCGVYGYPHKEASRIAISVSKEFPDSFEEIHFVLFSSEHLPIWLESASELLGTPK